MAKPNWPIEINETELCWKAEKFDLAKAIPVHWSWLPINECLPDHTHGRGWGGGMVIQTVGRNALIYTKGRGGVTIETSLETYTHLKRNQWLKTSLTLIGIET